MGRDRRAERAGGEGDGVGVDRLAEIRLLARRRGFLSERPDFLDIALVYALINFIGTIAVLRYIRRGRAGAGDAGGSR